MKQKWILTLLPLLILGTVGCGQSEKTDNSSENKTSTNTNPSSKPTSEDLAKTDEVLQYDNFIKMPGNQETADPFVYRFNGKYYLYPTTSGGAVRCYVSSDMYNWEACDNGINATGYCYQYSMDSNHPDSSSSIPFAPEVTYFNGKFYMIMSPSGNGHYILSSDSPDGPYECITDNLGRSIDGSFYISDDEKIYMFGAGSGCIQGYELETNFTTFVDNVNFAVGDCHMGGWNEGPYLLNRYGEYYMTWTGTNYINRDYRVDYAYVSKDGNIASGSSYKRQKTIALETGDNFWGLGHSCTVLGPDMDSYYLAYHNMVSSRNRYLNFSRLSFDGSNMVTNYVRPSDCVGTDLPPFYCEDDSELDEVGKFLLSQTSTEDAFTVEYNIIGEGKMIFGYQDTENYSYIDFSNNTLTVHKVLKNNDTTIATGELKNEFDTDVLHTFRLQYNSGRLVVYFDNMMKINESGISLSGGKMGYESGDFSEIDYTAFSNVALGSSDTLSYNDETSLASNYDRSLSYVTGESSLVEVTSKKSYNQTGSHNMDLKESGDFVTYRMYAHENDTYQISMRLPADYISTSFQIQVDGGTPIDVTLNGNVPEKDVGDVLTDVVELDLEPGAHNITIINSGEELMFSELHYEAINNENNEYSLDLATDDLSDFEGRCGSSKKVTQESDGLHSENEGAYGLISNEEYKNVTVETDVKINSIEPDGYCGVLINVKDYSIEEDDVNDPQNYNGYQLVIANGKAQINYADFIFTNQVKGGKFTFTEGETYHIKAVSENNNYKLYIDDVLIIDYTANIGTLSGRVGIFSHNADVVFSSLSIY